MPDVPSNEISFQGTVTSTVFGSIITVGSTWNFKLKRLREDVWELETPDSWLTTMISVAAGAPNDLEFSTTLSPILAPGVATYTLYNVAGMRVRAGGVADIFVCCLQQTGGAVTLGFYPILSPTFVGMVCSFICPKRITLS